MKPATTLPILLLLTLLLFAPAHAQVPSILNYQGRVTVGGTNLTTNAAQFKFAFVNGAGTEVYWRNDGSTAAGEPSSAVSVAVAQGLYSTLLGDTTLPNMAALPSAVFTKPNVNLRVWFSPGGGAPFVQLGPDQRLGASGYALRAAAVDTPGDNNATNGVFAVVGGGQDNAASTNYSTVSGGSQNSSSADYATVGGGLQNAASGVSATTGGGYNNNALAEGATVAGGRNNDATAPTATVAGGDNNIAGGESSAVVGGSDNNAVGSQSFIGTGNNNDAFGSYAVIVSGKNNTNGGPFGFIGSGYRNTNTGAYGFVGSGEANIVDADHAAITGGRLNTAAGSQAFIGGGGGNIIDSGAAFSVVSGGQSNAVGLSSSNAFVGGGSFNFVEAGTDVTIAGGSFNKARGVGATVPGGAYNDAFGDDTFAAGVQSKATNTGSFVWGGTLGVDTTSTNDYSFTVRAPGGVRFITTTATDSLEITNTGGVNGVALAPGGTAWQTLSDSNAKTAVKAVDARAVLAKIKELDVTEWEYKHDPKRRYFGPMAQDFHEAFGLGSDDKTINTLDADGVLFLSVKGLVEELKERDEVIEELKTKLESFEQRLNSLPPAP